MIDSFCVWLWIFWWWFGGFDVMISGSMVVFGIGLLVEYGGLLGE